MHRSFISLVLAILLVALPAFTQSVQLPDTFTPWPEADAVVQQVMDEQKIVGCAIGLIKDHQIVYIKGYGTADKRKDMPATRDTSFRWASISKPVTGYAALQLVEQGKLDLDRDIRDYVPEFPDKGVTITARQLLGHQGGIIHYTNGELIVTERDYDVDHPYESVIVALDKFKESPLVNAPGEKYSYTTHGFILLSAVVERAGGEAYWQQVRERIAQPLGMTSFQPDYPWVDIPNRTEGYEVNDVMMLRAGNDPVHWKLGGGGYTSTIDDLARFAEAVINRKLLKPETLDAMWTAQKTTDGELTTYGLGIGVTGEGGDLQISHSGSQEKTRTNLVAYPNQGYGIVLMSNSHQTNTGAFTRALLEFIQDNDVPK